MKDSAKPDASSSQPLTREALEKWLAGMRAAEQITLLEDQERLPKMTQAEARAEFDMLCGLFAGSLSRDDQEAFDSDRLEYLLHRRRRLDRLAANQGKNP